jgi:hypothetical protein
VHLHAVAQALGVTHVRVRPLAVDGRVRWGEAGPGIDIRADMTDSRKRFTLAHELAHVALGHGGTRNRDAAAGSARDERLCDAVAARLLMPTAAITAWVSEGPVDAGRFLAEADRLQVSAAALIRRLNEVADDEHALLTFRKGRQYWVHPKPALGITPGGPGGRTVRLSMQANRHLDAVSTIPVRRRLLLRIGETAYQASCSLVCRPDRRSTVVAVATVFERSPHHDLTRGVWRGPRT